MNTYNCYNCHLFVIFIPKHEKGHSRLIYEANIFTKNYNNYNKFLTILKCSVELDFQINITTDSFMNSNFYVVDIYSLVQFARLNIFKALTPESTSVSISLDRLLFCLLFFQNFLKQWARKEVEIPFDGICFYTVIP